MRPDCKHDCKHDWVVTHENNYFTTYLCEKCGSKRTVLKGAEG